MLRAISDETGSALGSRGELGTRRVETPDSLRTLDVIRPLPSRACAVLCSLVVLAAADGRAQAGMETFVTLRSAVALAVQQNPGIGAAAVDVSIAEARVESSRGLDDLLLGLAGAWDRSRQRLLLNSPLQQPFSDAVGGTLTLIKPLRIGGEVGLALSSDYNRSRIVLPTNDDVLETDSRVYQLHNTALQLTLEVPLLRGAGVAAARAEQRRASTQRGYAQSVRELAVAALVRDVVVTYSELAFASSELEIRRAASRAAQDQLQRVAAEIDVGKQPPSASAEVEVAIGLREDAALLAEQALLERALDLARITGQRPPNVSHPLFAKEPLPLAEESPQLDVELSRALEYNPEVRAAAALVNSAAIDAEVAANGRLPLLELAGRGGPVGVGADMGSAYSGLTDFRDYSLSVAVKFQAALGNHAANGNAEAARGLERKATLRQTEIRQQTETAVIRSVTAMAMAHRRAAVLAESIKAATLDLNAERARFESGRSTNFDVLRRQDQLAQAELSALAARLTYASSRATLQALTGAILDQYGVILP